MMKILLDTSLYCVDDGTFNLHLLETTLSFIDEYLEGVLDEYPGAFYSEERLQPPMIESWNRYNEYAMIISTLRRLKVGGDNVKVEDKNIDYAILAPSDFSVLNKAEFQHMIDYVYHMNEQGSASNFVLFMAENNSVGCLTALNLHVNDKKLQLPFVMDPWLDRSGNFDKWIKDDLKDKKSIFPCKKICGRLAQELESNISIGNSKGSYFKECAKIIAHRNNYSDLEIRDAYEKNTCHFCRNDNKYILSVDLIHGHFEVFDGISELWIGSYTLSGEELDVPKTKGELKKTRKNHKLRRKNH